MAVREIYMHLLEVTEDSIRYSVRRHYEDDACFPFAGLTSRDSCCDGYQWENNRKRCILSGECPSGFFGTHCERPCRYPNYGKDCQRECVCHKKLCNHTTGCVNPDLTIEVNTTSGNVDNSTELQEESNLKILFISSNITNSQWKEKNFLSMWTAIDIKHKFMLIGVIVFAVLFLAIICIYLKRNSNKRASVHYYHCKKAQGSEQRHSNETLDL
ncbi:uncharacterized protein LOC134272678 [Saccostrea cucullata]|uniref:uncharacterized protein LOC134272678 n=1 Tax=Saccostrea cuccullata TaxID=36930 RepID=UPI002ED15773